MECTLIRQTEGIAAAKARGIHLGRPIKAVPENFTAVVRDWEDGSRLFINTDIAEYFLEMSLLIALLVRDATLLRKVGIGSNRFLTHRLKKIGQKK